MNKRPILILIILGALMILVGSSYAGQEGCNKVTATKTGSIVSQHANSCEGTPHNCKTGKECTPEEMEKCKAKCKSGKECTPEEMEQCKKNCQSSKSNTLGISTKTTGHGATCGTGHGCSSATATKASQKATAASDCSSKQSCQPKHCGSKSSI